MSMETAEHPFSERRAGVLCHPSSLPARERSGLLDAARWFLDFLVDAGLSVWQILPLNPADRHGSPYHSDSLRALDAHLLLGPQTLAEPPSARIPEPGWLRDFALYRVLTEQLGKDWTRWPAPLRDRDADALERVLRSHGKRLGRTVAEQQAAADTWRGIRRAARARGVLLFGDMPLYPAHHSADVWAAPQNFLLDAHGRPLRRAGVPPDYFSEAGQLWGNPVYDWERLRADGFAWWLDRMRHELALHDVVRIDHFRGLAAFWTVPPDATDARAGAWTPAPGRELLGTLRSALGGLPLVAEDLGYITDDVLELRDAFDLPGMRVLQFAFSGDPGNPHLPEHYPTNAVGYTGTHDNDTLVGWYGSLDERTRAWADALAAGRGPMPRALVRVLLESPVDTAIVPLQDFLGLGGAHRMNTPGRATGNWRWCFERTDLDDDLAARIRADVSSTGRLR